MLVRLKELSIFVILSCTALVQATFGQRFDSYSQPTIFNDDEFSNENIHYFGPPSDAFWRQFWDVFNYRGPTQEDSFSRPISRPAIRPIERPAIGPVLRPVERPSGRPYFPDYGYEEQYIGPEYYIPRRETARPLRQEYSSDSEEEYNRYRDYFYRRYGNNFLD